MDSGVTCVPEHTAIQFSISTGILFVARIYTSLGGKPANRALAHLLQYIHMNRWTLAKKKSLHCQAQCPVVQMADVRDYFQIHFKYSLVLISFFLGGDHPFFSKGTQLYQIFYS
jgi:hypothetical protein